MALQQHSQAPDFQLESTSGSTFTLSKSAQGRPLIIYFYPKDFTPGCTKEACEFRDSFEFFNDLDIEIYGISRDSVATHHEFKKAHNLPFHLLADEDGKIADLYEASVPLINFTKRVTYLLDKDHKILGAYTNLFGARKHIREMVKLVKEEELV